MIEIDKERLEEVQEAFERYCEMRGTERGGFDYKSPDDWYCWGYYEAQMSGPRSIAESPEMQEWYEMGYVDGLGDKNG